MSRPAGPSQHPNQIYLHHVIRETDSFRLPPGAAQAELIAHRHHLSISEMDLDELRAANRYPVFILQRGHDLARLRLDHVGRVTPRVLPVEAERDPAMAAL